MVFLAKSRDSSSRPAWVLRAPQQPWLLGATTSQPSATSTRTVAEFTREKKTCCTHPRRTPTRLRFSPADPVNSGIVSSLPSFGMRASIARMRAGSRSMTPALRSLSPIPKRW
jgi:hypothetical protein